jgi:hypothetical protein
MANDSTSIPELAFATLIFREDDFDAVTRLRRGRFYKPSGDSRPSQQYAWPHPVHGGIHGSSSPVATATGAVERRLHVFEPALLTPSDQVVVIGDKASCWRVLGAERIITGDYLVTLKARHALGILPELDVQKIPEIGRAKAVETYEALVDSAYRAGPVSVVDRARDAAQWFLATWIADLQGENALLHDDLSPLVNRIEKIYENDKANKPEMVLSIGRTIARLHARKPNEQKKRNLRPLMESDAEYALAAFGLLVREVRWTS